jgi:predicted nucleic acid-binding protein
VLVDTSVWSLAFRKRGPAEHAQVTKLAELAEARDEIAITGTILQEVLQTFRDESAFSLIEAKLEPLVFLTLGRVAFVEAARLHRRCAARGFSVSTADCQIATSALRYKCSLLTADSDFERIARVCDLSLL